MVGTKEKGEESMRFKHALLCLGLCAGLVFLSVTGCDKDKKEKDLCGNGICDEGEDRYNCPEDCYCGNGTIDPYEECDGQDLGGATCLDVECSGGILGCYPPGHPRECTLDRSRCQNCEAICGDGIREGNEECDCGTDPDNLPSGCDAINGQGVCSEECTWNTVCGDGVKEGPEECDCGTDPDNLPAGCDAINGHPDSHCTANCTVKPECISEPWNQCDPTIGDACCPDMWGLEYTCDSSSFTIPICVLQCSGLDECYYGQYCEAAISACYFAFCGPGDFVNPAVGRELNAPCQIPGGGGPGWCLPLGIAEDEMGICVEHGTAEHMDACDYVPGASIDLSFQPRSMDWTRCEKGFCIENNANEGGGECLQFCDWRAVYFDNEMECPDGYSCLDLSSITVSNDEDDGLRTSEFGYCIEKDINPAEGLVTCDVLNGDIIPGRTESCSDYNDAANDNYICWPIHFGDGEFGWGTPVGWCVNVGQPADKMIGEECDVENDLCEEGSFCFPELTTDWSSQGVCMPFCLVDEDDCGTRGDMPADSFCITVSAWYRPGATQGSTGDGSPAHLGMCGCPADGCTGEIAECGNDVVEAGEECDGTDLDNETCLTLGYYGGDLSCTDQCEFDLTDCEAAGWCGDGVLQEAEEECDGTEWGTITECADLDGFTGGDLSCAADCTFDTSLCTSD